MTLALQNLSAVSLVIEPVVLALHLFLLLGHDEGWAGPDNVD